MTSQHVTTLFFFPDILVRFYWCDKDGKQKQPGKDRIYLALQTLLRFIIELRQSRNPKQEPGSWHWKRNHGVVLINGFLSKVCSAYFLIQPRTTYPGAAPPTINGALPHQSLLQKMSHNLMVAISLLIFHLPSGLWVLPGIHSETPLLRFRLNLLCSFPWLLFIY